MAVGNQKMRTSGQIQRGSMSNTYISVSQNKFLVS